MLETLARFRLVAGEIEDQAGVQVLEDRVPFGTGQPVDRRHRGLGVTGAIQRPGREQRRGQIGDRAANRLRQSTARDAVLLVLERAHAKHQFGDAIALVGLRDAFGVFHRFVDVAVDQERQESAVEQLAVLRIVPQRRPVKGGGGAGVALLAGMTGGEITARGGHPGQVRQRGRLRGKLNRRGHQEYGERGAECAPGEARRRHGLVLQ